MAAAAALEHRRGPAYQQLALCPAPVTSVPHAGVESRASRPLRDMRVSLQRLRFEVQATREFLASLSNDRTAMRRINVREVRIKVLSVAPTRAETVAFGSRERELF